MSLRLRSTLSVALVAAGTLGSGVALAQAASIYCCTDGNGRKVCADFLPTECAKRAYEERDSSGFVVKQVAAPLTAEQQARRDAELAKKAEEERRKLEERRRDLALLSTYADEKDIDRARELALADADKLVKQAEKGLADALARQAKINKEKEFYKDKALPALLKDQIAGADRDVANNTQAVEDRRTEKAKTATKYDEEKRKYRELKLGKDAKPVEADNKPRREVVVQPNEGAAAENRNAPPAAPVVAAQQAAAPAPAAAQAAAKPAGK